MTPTLSIITPTAGRPTLIRALASLASQLEDGDEMLVLRRDGVPQGNATRDAMMRRALGSHLWWMDDDDVATEDALSVIRRAVGEDPGTIHIFKMESLALHGRILWERPVLEFGEVGGTMCVVPNIPDKLGTWIHTQSYGGVEPGRGGDFHFLTETLEKLDREPIFHEDIIARIRP